MKPRKTIYIECSATYLYGGNTGIPNVVKSIIREAQELQSAMGIDVVPVVYNGFVFTELPSVLLFQRPVAGKNEFFKKVISVVKRLEDMLPKQIRFVVKAASRRFGYKYISLVKTRNFKKVLFNKGDVLLLPDQSWYAGFEKEVKRISERGVIISVLIHDLIPIYFPNSTFPYVSNLLKRYCINLFPIASLVICISKSVELDVRTFIEREDIINKKNIITVHNGRSVISVGDKKSIIRETIEKITTNPSPKYLLVSTIEPRKNHLYALKAFDTLWKEGSDSLLIIVGKVGWMCDEIVKQLYAHPELNKKLFIIHDASDAERDYLYQASSGVLSLSYVEGFSLPIIEALEKGKPIFVTDIPVHREVAGKFGIFTDLHDPSSLTKAITSFEKEGLPGDMPPLSSFTWPTWKETVEKMLRAVVR